MHQPGTPAWIELTTHDLAACIPFYEQLLGWTFEDSGSAYGHYAMITVGDDLVGGAWGLAEAEAADDRPSDNRWGVFLATEDVDTTTAHVEQHGGTVVKAPADVPGAGRFATYLSPAGAEVSAWQAGGTDGFTFSGDPGTPVWFELMAQDFDSSTEFYKQVFALDAIPMWDPSQGQPENRYVTHGSGEDAAYGICEASGFIPEEHGSYWRVYFAVPDCDEAVNAVTKLGGRVLDGPQDSPFGRLATVVDPSGAQFQVIDTTTTVPFEQA